MRRSEEKKIRHFFNRFEPSFKAAALENLKPTLIETLVACEPLVTSCCVCAFAIAIYDRLSKRNIPDTERKILVDIFGKLMPRLREENKTPLTALNEVAVFAAEAIESFHYSRKAVPCIQEALALLNQDPEENRPHISLGGGADPRKKPNYPAPSGMQ